MQEALIGGAEKINRMHSQLISDTYAFKVAGFQGTRIYAL